MIDENGYGFLLPECESCKYSLPGNSCPVGEPVCKKSNCFYKRVPKEDVNNDKVRD